MTGRRHRSNCELVGQGFANIASAFFGGICVTGTIARTATNVRSGAHGPIAGMSHSVFLMVLLFIAAPLARYIPLAALGGILAVVAYHMVEKSAIRALFRSSWGDMAVLLTTFLLVVFRDLTEGIVVGFALGALLFIDRMGRETSLVHHEGLVAEDRPDDANGARDPYDAHAAADADTVIYRLSGAFFFGAASTVGSILDRISDQRKNFVLDCSNVLLLDSSAANVLAGTARKAANGGIRFIITGTSQKDRKLLSAAGVRPPDVEFADTIEKALDHLRKTARSA